MKKTISFGKIDLMRCGRKENAVDVEIELSDMPDGEREFSVMGSIWNSAHTDLEEGGQCLDEIAKHLRRNARFMEIYRLWKEWHLNSMHAGTRRQEEAIRRSGVESNYDDDCAYLKSIGLYTDDLAEDEYIPSHPKKRTGYEYGTAWICRRIPDDVMKKIEEIMK